VIGPVAPPEGFSLMSGHRSLPVPGILAAISI